MSMNRESSSTQDEALWGLSQSVFPIIAATATSLANSFEGGRYFMRFTSIAAKLFSISEQLRTPNPRHRLDILRLLPKLLKDLDKVCTKA